MSLHTIPILVSLKRCIQKQETSQMAYFVKLVNGFHRLEFVEIYDKIHEIKKLLSLSTTTNFSIKLETARRDVGCGRGQLLNQFMRYLQRNTSKFNWGKMQTNFCDSCKHLCPEELV